METLIKGLPNLPFPTLGGAQVWVDRFYFAGWRIQKNVLTGHHRLLSPGNIRRGWGSFRGCRETFEKNRAEKGLRNPGNHLVLLVHGMAGWKETFLILKKHLVSEGFFADGYNYPSLKGTLGEQGDDLNAFLDTLEGISEITLIGHSQGGMVIRQALASQSQWQRKIRLNGVIFIGTPNQGAAVADFSKRLKALGKVAPRVRDQLTSDYAKNIPVPKARIGLIAGSALRGRGINPVVKGDDDGVVGVNEVWIPGEFDRLLVTSDHFTLANRRKSREAIVRFLNGRPLAG